MKLEQYYSLADLFKKHGYNLYLVGGATRDSLLKLEVSDYDLVSDASVNEIMSFYPNIDISFEKYGSIRLIFENEKFDVTTLRKEEYISPRKPSKIEYVKNINEDYLRRDFTINAIYMDIDGKYYDFCDGIKDISNKVIKMIGDPDIRLKEDPLRILRALRFSIQLDFKIDEELEKSIFKNLYLLGEVSYTLVNKEIELMKHISLEKYNLIVEKYKLNEYILLDDMISTQEVIDLHCDTITKICDNGANLFKNNYQVDINKLVKSSYLMQTFAIFLHKGKGHDYNKCLEYIEFFNKKIKKNSNLIHQVKNYQDLINAKSLKKIGALLSIEESGILDGDLNKLNILYDKGVRMMTLTWNYVNEIGYPNVDLSNGYDPLKINVVNGLTSFGFEVVKKMNELGIIIDVSHLSDKGFYDVISATKYPICASHSNSRYIHNCSRNLTDDMIKKLHDNGGVMGINFCKDFVCEKDEDLLKGVIKHIKHIKEIGCLNALSLGSDFDGINKEEPLSDASKLYLLKQELIKEGFTKLEIEKIFYKNFIRVMKKVLK